MAKARILALDGGGIRGVFSVAFLAHVEEHLESPLRDSFDLIAGTSTGAIIALGLASGLTARQILDAYREAGPKIFRRRAGMLHRLAGPGHDGNALREWLQRLFGDRRLSDANVDVAIPTLDLSTNQVRVWKTDHHPELHGGGDKMMWEVALASAAAPSYLPPVQMDGQGAYVDGGLWANNPAMVAVVEAVRYRGARLDEVTLLSIGTGRLPRWLGFQQIRHRGIVGWGRSLVDIVFSAQSAAAHNQARLLLGEDRYLRIDVDLARKIDLDDAREIDLLQHLGEAAGLDKLNSVRKLLASSAGVDQAV